jgi:hypothetical protein
MHLGVDLPVPGRYPLELKIFHHELPRGGVRSVMLLNLQEDRPATLTTIADADLPVSR